MSTQQMPQLSIDRYVVIHVATTCDEHGVYVTKDSAEVIEFAWILVDATSLEEVSAQTQSKLLPSFPVNDTNVLAPNRSLTKASWSNPSTRRLLHCAVSLRWKSLLQEFVSQLRTSSSFLSETSWLMDTDDVGMQRV